MRQSIGGLHVRKRRDGDARPMRVSLVFGGLRGSVRAGGGLSVRRIGNNDITALWELIVLQEPHAVDGVQRITGDSSGPVVTLRPSRRSSFLHRKAE
jgi:hypothetical protein